MITLAILTCLFLFLTGCDSGHHQSSLDEADGLLTDYNYYEYTDSFPYDPAVRIARKLSVSASIRAAHNSIMRSIVPGRHSNPSNEVI